MKIGIIGNTAKPHAKPAIQEFAELLTSHEIEYFYAESLRTFLQLPLSENILPIDKLRHQVDLVVAFGGDGTILQTAGQIGGAVPILGVNIGTLGFLAEVVTDELQQAILDLKNGNYSISQRMVLHVRIEHENSSNDYFALNDVVIDKRRGSRLIIIDALVNDALLNSYRADGLIISTPTGATAYSMSAGGPILEPCMDAVIITPICPHSLTVRPIVLASDRKITLSIRKEAEPVQIVIDGQPFCPLTSREKVIIQKADYSVNLINITNRDFFQVIRKKLNWGTDIPGLQNKG